MRDIKEEYDCLKKTFLQDFLQLLTDPKITEINEEIAQKTSITIGKEQNFYLILFPGNIPEIIEELSDYFDQKMFEECQVKFTNIKSIREKISIAIKYRLAYVVPIQVQKKIAAYHSSIVNIASNLKIYAKTCDIIWRLAGDQSTDFNYYTKRALLLPIYMRAISIYCQDSFKNYDKTEIFVKNALDKVVNIASLKQKIKLPKKENIPILRLFL
ncbi:MAG: COQ9 family protein [Rickettsiaceae bacterium]|nr:COQ9 family protein [Rickettsiaceae bacterium]